MEEESDTQDPGQTTGPDPTTARLTSKWRTTNPMSDLTEQQSRILLAKVVKFAVLTIFKNHVYSFNGQVYIQLAGGPIGLRLTSIVARVVMDKWMSVFLVDLDEAGFMLWEVIKYVDDINMVCDSQARLEVEGRWSNVLEGRVGTTGQSVRGVSRDEDDQADEGVCREVHLQCTRDARESQGTDVRRQGLGLQGEERGGDEAK